MTSVIFFSDFLNGLTLLTLGSSVFSITSAATVYLKNTEHLRLTTLIVKRNIIDAKGDNHVSYRQIIIQNLKIHVQNSSKISTNIILRTAQCPWDGWNVRSKYSYMKQQKYKSFVQLCACKILIMITYTHRNPLLTYIICWNHRFSRCFCMEFITRIMLIFVISPE